MRRPVKSIETICHVLLLLISSLNPSCSQTQRLEPSDDTWIDGLSSTRIHGGDSRLSICPVANYWIYVKFDLTSLAGSIRDAELRLTRFDGSRPEEISLYVVTGDDWNQSSLTGPNRPAPVSPDPAFTLAKGSDQGGHDTWRSPELLALLQQEQAGDGIVSLLLREDPSSTLDVRNYFSSEGANIPERRPHLFVTIEEVSREQVHDDWEIVSVGEGVKPSFDFGPNDRIHIMGMTEETNGVVWHAVSDRFDGPWNPQIVSQGYFYGPGDIRVSSDGTAHLAWHNHTTENPAHATVESSGAIQEYIIRTVDSHDGWDNSLAVDASGGIHMASVFPVTFGSANGLQYGGFDGLAWSFETSIPDSGPFMYGFNTSIAIDRQGRPHIVYCRANNWTDPGDLRYAVRRDGGWSISTVVTDGIRGRFPTLALDHWDRPHVAWVDVDETDHGRIMIRYGVLNSEEWTVEDVDVLENAELGFSEARKSVSLVLDSNYRPHLAYTDKQTIRYAVKPFDQWQYTTVASNPVDLYKGLVVLRLNSKEEPALVFWQRTSDGPGSIRYARMKPDTTDIRDWNIFEPE